MPVDILGSLVIKGDTKIVPKENVYLKTILFDGDFINVDEKIAQINSTVFSGIVCTDYFVSRGDEVYFWREFYQTLVKKITDLRFNATEFPSSEALKRQIECLVSRNHYPPYSRFKITIFGDVDDRVHYIICQERLKSSPYAIDLGAQALDDAGVFLEENPVPLFVDPLTRYNIVPLSVALADREIETKDKTFSVRLSPERKIMNSTLGNIYYFYGEKLYTPLHGRLEDSINKEITAVVESLNEQNKSLKITIDYVDSLSEEDLLIGTGCFTASARYGIRIVRGYRKHRFRVDQARMVAMAFENRLKY